MKVLIEKGALKEHRKQDNKFLSYFVFFMWLIHFGTQVYNLMFKTLAGLEQLSTEIVLIQWAFTVVIASLFLHAYRNNSEFFRVCLVLVTLRTVIWLFQRQGSFHAGLD